MPNYGTYSGDFAGWKTSDAGRVVINGTEQPRITCLAIEQSADQIADRAVLRIGGSDLTLSGPITLNRFNFPWKAGSKVEIYLGNGLLIFRGFMTRRMDNGEKDAIVWEAQDVRYLLNHIHLHGCLVRDPYDGTVKYCTRYTPRTNPEGQWNCIGATIAGATVPVFSPVAEMGQVIEEVDEAFSTTLEVGTTTAWTPKRFLQYLRLITVLVRKGDLDGTNTNWWRTCADSTTLGWSEDSLNIRGNDESEGNDPLERKMPDIDFRGMRMLGAICKTLDASGTHGLTVEHLTDKSFVRFFARGASAATSRDQEYDMSINLLRGGAQVTFDTAYDFDLDEDASQIAESALVGGGIPHIETSIRKDGTHTELVQAWSEAEQTCFLNIIEGDGTNAMYPAEEGLTTNTLTANGSGGSPLVEAHSDEAVNFARQFFPHVFKAFIIDSAQILTQLAGYDNRYSETSQFPVINGLPRPALEEQLQYYIKDTKRMLSRYPVRVRVKNTDDTDDKYVDALYNNGLRMSDNGWIWLDGLAESQNGEKSCIYEGDIVGAPLDVTLRHIKINCAVPTDHRVIGYSEVFVGESNVDKIMRAELGGLTMTYIDSPHAYKDEMQVSSEPVPFPAAIADSTTGSTVTLPLNRQVPLTDERQHAEYAAERKLFSSRWPKRRSRWSMVGIRPDFQIGQWINRVNVVGGPAGDSAYDINAPIENILHDFVNQTTVIGGLLSQVSSNKSKGEAFATARTLPSKAGAAQPTIGKNFAGQSADSKGSIGGGSRQIGANNEIPMDAIAKARQRQHNPTEFAE